MREFKGTPGPWTVEADSSNVISISDTNENEVASIIADNENDLLTELEWDNARLIAAAPDLLTALQELVHLHTCEQEGLSSGQPSPADWLKAIDQASDAIIKSSGREVQNGQ